MFYIHGDINVRYAGKNQKQSSTVVCRLTSALLCHVSGVTVGADYYVYLRYLVTLSERGYWEMITDDTLRFEKGYISLTWLLGSIISVAPQFFSFVIYSVFLFFFVSYHWQVFTQCMVEFVLVCGNEFLFKQL